MRPSFPKSSQVPLCLLLMAFCSLASAAGSPRPAGANAHGFDTAQVRKLYQDGDFEPAIRILEGALQSGRVPEHRDSVFVFKHLGVMYAASENTRERGKYFMLQLLTIEPTARIMDMYASDMIYMIFRNIQEEFTLSHGNAGHSSQKHEPERGRSQAASGPGIGKTIAWAGAAAVVLGAGATLYLLSNSGSGETRVNHEVK